MKPDNLEIVARIEQRLEALGLSPRKASLESGYGPDAIRDLKRDPSVIPRLDTMTALARTLQVSPQWLAFGVEDFAQEDPNADLPVIGEVAAGVWHDLSLEMDESPFAPVLGGRNMRYSPTAQYGLVVRGTSLNRQAQSGDILRCLDIGNSGLRPRPGDLVVVERRRAQLGQKEVTAKVLKRVDGRLELWPDSTDPRWAQPILVEGLSGDEDVRAIAVVDRIIRQLRTD